MSTMTAPIESACPDWCTVDPAEHARELWNMGGDCFHKEPDTVVVDCTTGPEVGRCDAPMPAEPATVSMVVVTNPDGHETASPSFTIDTGDNLGLAQFEALIVAMSQTLATYRSWAGGEGMSAAAQQAGDGDVLTLTVRLNVLEAMFYSKTYYPQVAAKLGISERAFESRLDAAGDLRVSELRAIADATGVGMSELVRSRVAVGEPA